MPRALDDVKYRMFDGKDAEGEVAIVRIASRHSRFKGRRVDHMDSRERRKIENLFILSMPKNRLRFDFA